MKHALEIKGLVKDYGKLRAVDNLDLEVPEGAIYGILGPNGSGKTTTLSIVLGILNASAGEYQWQEQEKAHLSRKKIGALLEQPNFYPYLSARRNLKIACDIKEIPYDNIDKVLADVDLSERADHKFKTYSFGMKQRLAIAATLLANPKVLVLDEPTNGLDPKGIAEVRQLIRNIAVDGRTILLASHMLDEVEKVCTHVAVLKKGKLLASGSVSDVLSDECRFELGAENLQELKARIEAWDKIINLEQDRSLLIVTFKEDISATAVNQWAYDNGIVLSHLQAKRKNLEEQFLDLIA